MVCFLRLSAVLPSGAFQAPLVGASVLPLLPSQRGPPLCRSPISRFSVIRLSHCHLPLLPSQRGPPLCRSPIWSLSSSASWCLCLALTSFSERSSSLPFSYLSIFSDSVESLSLAKAIRYFQ